MATLLHLSVLLGGLLLLSIWFDSSPLEVLPLIWSALAFLLYGLCYFRALSAVDLCFAVLLLGIGIGLYSVRKSIPAWRKKNTSLQQLIFFALIILICLLTQWHSAVISEDDLNYWATSVYALYSRNGLEPIHANVAMGYGSYPLGMQLLEWWFMHAFSRGWQDRWLFIAYGILTFSFVLPVFRHYRKAWYMAPVYGLLTLLLTSFACSFSLKLSPDVFMGTVYANCLLCSIRASQQENRRHLQEILIAAQLYLLAVTKSVGMLWAVFALVFHILLTTWFSPQTQLSQSKKHVVLRQALLLIPALIGCFAWKIACILLDRSTYLKVDLDRSFFVWNEERAQLVKDYFYTLFRVPYARWPALSIAVVLLLLGAAFFFVYKAWGKHRRELSFISAYLFGTTFLYFIVVLCGMFTMFWGESFTYDHIAAMVGRYSAPALTALAFVPSEILINYCEYKRCETKRLIAAAAAVVCLLTSANYLVTKCFLFPSLNTSSRKIDLQAEYEYFSALRQEVEQLPDPHGTFLLYFDEGDSIWTHRVSIQWVCRDISVQSFSSLDYGIIWWFIETQPATHLYIKGEPGAVLGLEENQAQIEFNTLYEITRAESGTSLVKSEPADH